MQKKAVNLLATLAVAAVAVLACVATSEAALILNVCNDIDCQDGDDTRVVDESGGDLAIPGVGIVTASGQVGGYDLSVTVQTKPAYGTAEDPALQLDFSVLGTGAIYIYAFDSGYTGDGTAHLRLSTDTATQTTQFGLGATVNNLFQFECVFSATGAADSTLPCGTLPGSLTYDLLALAIITRTSQGQSAGTVTATSVTSVPEPAGLALCGMAFFGLVRARRQRFSA